MSNIDQTVRVASARVGYISALPVASFADRELNVRDGSNATEMIGSCDVRFPPESDQRADITGPKKRTSKTASDCLADGREDLRRARAGK
jgi:hypothetical protein